MLVAWSFALHFVLSGERFLALNSLSISTVFISWSGSAMRWTFPLVVYHLVSPKISLFCVVITDFWLELELRYCSTKAVETFDLMVLSQINWLVCFFFQLSSLSTYRCWSTWAFSFSLSPPIVCPYLVSKGQQDSALGYEMQVLCFHCRSVSLLASLLHSWVKIWMEILSLVL